MSCYNPHHNNEPPLGFWEASYLWLWVSPKIKFDFLTSACMELTTIISPHLMPWSFNEIWTMHESTDLYVVLNKM
jgi:hypothetical protein